MLVNKKILFGTILICLTLFIIGLSAFARLLKFLEPNIEGIEFVITGKLTLFLLSLMLALIPVLTFATWKLSRIDLLNRRIYSGLKISIIIAATLFVRHQQVKIFFNRVVRPFLLTNDKSQIIYPIDPRNFVYYLLGGFWWVVLFHI